MGYSLSYADDWRNDWTFDQEVRSPLDALRVVTDYHRRDWDHDVRDDAGQHVSLAQLLNEAVGQAADPASQQQLMEALADHVALTLYPWDDYPPFAYPPDSYWTDAGRHWANTFRQPPSASLLDELTRRHRYHRCDLFLDAANKRLVEIRLFDRAQRMRGVGHSQPLPLPAPRPRPGRCL